MSRGNPRIGFRAPADRVEAYEAAAERVELDLSEWLRRAADRALLPGQSGPAIEERTPPRGVKDAAGPALEPEKRGKVGRAAPSIRTVTAMALPGGNEMVAKREKKMLGGKRFTGPDPKGGR